MGITKDKSARMAILPSLLSFLLFSCYLNLAQAHDPGLSMVDAELTDNKLFVHITFARKDIEQFVLSPNSQNTSLSEVKFDLANVELQRFIVQAIKFSDGGVVLKSQLQSIELDKSDAVHFRLYFNTSVKAELTIHSAMIDKFALGHRQFVKVRLEDGVISSRILSVREPLFKVNLPEPELWSVFANFVKEGVWHIWIGFDHILFVITLLLPTVLVFQQGQWYPQHGFNQTAKQTVKVISAFTIAHSLTLSLTVLNLIALPGQIVESMIAASVIFAACNNIYLWVNDKLWVLAFVFGLVHGMGFAAVLHGLGLPMGTRSLALIGFNLGVELGQLTIVALILPALYLFRTQHFYKPVLMQCSSYLIAVLGMIWLFERMTNITVTGYFI